MESGLHWMMQRNPTMPALLKRHKVDFCPEESITHLTSGRNQVIIATRDKKVISVDTSTSKQVDCDLARYLGNRLSHTRIHKVFTDPTGKFTLISLAQASDNQPIENLLFVKRIQPLTRLKNHLISAVAWNHPRPNSNTDVNSSGTILLGTTKGLILQTDFIHSDETKFFPLSPGPRQYMKEVFDVGPELGAITGLFYHQIPNTSTTEKTYAILVSTNSRLYRMVGNVPSNVEPPPLHLVFAQNSANYQDVPGRLNSAKLDVFYPNPAAQPTRFAWLTELGIMTGEISSKAFESDEETLMVPYNNSRDTEQQLLLSSTPSSMSPTFNSLAAYYYDKPISVIATNFHVIVLFRHCLRAICILNELTVFEEYFSTKYGNVLGMSKDPIKNIVWLFYERAVFRYKVSNENKNVWKIFLEQRKFDLARKYSANDESNYDRVICEEAQHYFRDKEYVKSAEIYAKSKKPFEEVSLMFMEIKCSEALKKYLLMKLERFDPIQMTQITMTLGWLLEIIISSISVIKTLPSTDRNDKELSSLQSELKELLQNKQIVDCLKRYSHLFYGLIRNYADLETFIKLAELIGDHKHVIQYYMDSYEWQKALDIMRSIKKDEYYYIHGHILMKHKSKELVDALIDQPSIEPSKLIPVLIHEDPLHSKCSETMRYLEHCIKNLQTDSRVVYNYLFELYARHKDEGTLLEFLSDASNQYHLDLQLCLRLSTELGLFRTCVSLYSLMELYDEALSLALNFDVELAKSIAKRAESEDHQKRLWLLIAEKVLTDNLDIQVATGLLRECRLLKIEDILPFFPDYTTIDFFKDAIRQSLQEYKDQIMALKDGTYENIADEIRNEIRAFRSRYSIIKIGQRCEICSRNLSSRTFYVFPCGHLFHSDCIIKAIIGIDPNYKVEDISSECIFCGDLLPKYIDKIPMIDSDDD